MIDNAKAKQMTLIFDNEEIRKAFTGSTSICWKSVSALYAWHGLQIANVSIARQLTVPSTIHQVMSPGSA